VLPTLPDAAPDPNAAAAGPAVQAEAGRATEQAPPPGAAAESGWWRRTFASLSIRPYRIFFLGQGVSLVGTWMRQTAQGWLVYDLTGSKLLLGTVSALGLFPLFLFSSVAGTFADRLPKRRLLLWAQSAMMLVSLAVATLVASGHIRVWHLMVSACLIGTAFAVDLPTRQSFYITLVGRRDLLNAIALNSAAFNAARILGPATAGVIMATFGLAACFYADAASFLAVIGSLLLLRVQETPPVAAQRSHWQMLWEGFAYIRETHSVKTLLALLAVVCVFGWSYVALIPAYARDVLNFREAGYGALLAAHGVGALAGALFVAGRGERRRARAQVFGGLWLFSVTLFCFAVARATWLAAVLLALSGAGLIVFISTANTQIQWTVPDALRGRVMGVWGLVFGGGLPLGSVLLGALAEEFGIQAALGFGAVVCLVVSVIMYLRLPPKQAEPARAAALATPPAEAVPATSAPNG
jgi:MFS family permease